MLRRKSPAERLSECSIPSIISRVPEPFSRNMSGSAAASSTGTRRPENLCPALHSPTNRSRL